MPLRRRSCHGSPPCDDGLVVEKMLWRRFSAATGNGGDTAMPPCILWRRLAPLATSPNVGSLWRRLEKGWERYCNPRRHRCSAVWRPFADRKGATTRDGGDAASVPCDGTWKRIETPFWRRSPIRNTVQAIEATRRCRPGVVLQSAARDLGTILEIGCLEKRRSDAVCLVWCSLCFDAGFGNRRRHCGVFIAMSFEGCYGA